MGMRRRQGIGGKQQSRSGSEWARALEEWEEGPCGRAGGPAKSGMESGQGTERPGFHCPKRSFQLPGASAVVQVPQERVMGGEGNRAETGPVLTTADSACRWIRQGAGGTEGMEGDPCASS